MKTQEDIVLELLRQHEGYTFTVADLASEISNKQGTFYAPPAHSVRRAISNLRGYGFPIENTRVSGQAEYRYYGRERNYYGRERN